MVFAAPEALRTKLENLEKRAVARWATTCHFITQEPDLPDRQERDRGLVSGSTIVGGINANAISCLAAEPVRLNVVLGSKTPFDSLPVTSGHPPISRHFRSQSTLSRRIASANDAARRSWIRRRLDQGARPPARRMSKHSTETKSQRPHLLWPVSISCA